MRAIHATALTWVTLPPDNGELTVVLDSPGPVRAIAFGSQGRMYLGDDETNQVRVFERDGDRWKPKLVLGTDGAKSDRIADLGKGAWTVTRHDVMARQPETWANNAAGRFAFDSPTRHNPEAFFARREYQREEVE